MKIERQEQKPSNKIRSSHCTAGAVYRLAHPLPEERDRFYIKLLGDGMVNLADGRKRSSQNEEYIEVTAKVVVEGDAS